MYDPRNPQMANPNDSPFQLGTMMAPPQPQQMQVKTQMVKVPPPAPVVAAPEPVVTEPAPQVETPVDDGTVKTAQGTFKVLGAGDYRYNDGTHDIKIAAADAPPEVTAYAAKKYPGPGEIVVGDKRYKTTPDGKVQAYIGALGKWGEIPDDQVDALPEEVRKPYYESKSAKDRETWQHVMGNPMVGGVTPSPAQIKQKEQEILGISQSMNPNQGTQGISSPEQLQQAQMQAKADYQTAQQSGNKEAVAAAKKKMDHLADTHISQTPDGGYIRWEKAPIGDQYMQYIVTPKEPKKSGENDWTKDPENLNADATARAQSQNRRDVTQQAGGVILNNSAQRILDDYGNSYAKWYRAQQLAGDHPDAPLPELMAEKVTKQMNSGDAAGAIDTIVEMQKQLSEIHGSGYMGLLPDYSAAGTYNNGITDYIPSRIPEQAAKEWDVKSSTIANPKTAGREKDIKETPLALADPAGQLKHAETAQTETTNSLGADPTNAAATLAAHESTIYKHPDLPIKNYVTPKRGVHPDQADRVTAFDQHTQDVLQTDPAFQKIFSTGIVKAMEDAAGETELGRAGGRTTTSSVEGEEGSARTTTKSGPITPESYKKTMEGLFGSETPILYYQSATTGKKYSGPNDAPNLKPVTSEIDYYVDANGKKYSGSKDAPGLTPVPKATAKWSDPGVIQNYAEKFYKMSPQRQIAEAERSALAKTLLMADGVVSGKNGHIEIDSRINNLAPSFMVKSLKAALEPQAQKFYENNKPYFDENLRRNADPDTRINENELIKALKDNLVTQVIRKWQGQVLQK